MESGFTKMADDDALQISPADRDIAIRTMLGEEGTPEGWAGVASTMLNRAKSGNYGGKSLTGVAFAPSQFEAWTSNSKKLLSYSTDDPAYQKAAQIFDGVASGELPDFTNGATHFYAPKAQAELGRNAPSWDNGKGTQLGKTLFFAPNGPVSYKAPAQQAINAATSKGSSDPFADYGVNQQQGGQTAVAMSDPFEDYGVGKPEPASPAKVTGKGASLSYAPPEAASPQAAQPVSSPKLSDPFEDYGVTQAKAVPSAPPATDLGAQAAAQRGFVSGIPILGPALEKGADYVGSHIGSLISGKPVDQVLAEGQAIGKATDAAHPIANTVGGITGAVAGTAPLVSAYPAAFGINKAATLVPNMLAGATTGGLIGAADSAVRSGGNLDDIQRGAAIGGAGGAAAPVIGKAIGWGAGKILNKLSGTTPEARNVAGTLSNIGMTNGEVRNALTRLGPNAMVADIDPALTTEAGGLASLGDKPTSILKSRMAARASQADNRVATAIDQKLGVKPDLEATKQAFVDQAQQAAEPFYTAARNSAQPMDITPVLNSINAQLKDAVGGEAAVLSKAKGYLTDQKAILSGPNGAPQTLLVPKSDPGALLKVRQALDGDIQSLERNGTIDGTSAGKSALRAASNLRGQIDSVLKSDPNIAAGDAAFASQMKLKDALNEGTQLFTKGTRLDDFLKTVKTLSPDELNAYRAGARIAIGDAFEEARRGTLSGAQSMFGKASANRAKLDALFPKAGDVLDMLHGEAAMRATEQRVAQNSATAERQAVQNKYSPKAEAGINAAVPIVGEALGGGMGAVAATGARLAYRQISNAFTEGARNRMIEGTAKGLSATGPEQQEFLRQLERATKTQKVDNLLTRGGEAVGNLLTNAGANRYRLNALSGN